MELTVPRQEAEIIITKIAKQDPLGELKQGQKM